MQKSTCELLCSTAKTAKCKVRNVKKQFIVNLLWAKVTFISGTNVSGESREDVNDDEGRGVPVTKRMGENVATDRSVNLHDDG